MCIGANGLAVQNRRRRFEILAILGSYQRTQGVIEKEPGVVAAPLPKAVENRLPAWEGLWKQPPGTAALDQIEDGVEQRAERSGWPAHALARRKEWFDQSPLLLGEVRVVGRILHRPDSAARESGQFPRWPTSTHISRIFNSCYVRCADAAGDRIGRNLTFRTGSYDRPVPSGTEDHNLVRPFRSTFRKRNLPNCAGGSPQHAGQIRRPSATVHRAHNWLILRANQSHRTAHRSHPVWRASRGRLRGREKFPPN